MSKLIVKKAPKKAKVKVLKRMGRPSNLPGVWADMARAANGVDGLSKELGKSVRQLRRIAHRESPFTGSTKVAARVVAEKYGMLDALEKWDRDASTTNRS